MNSSPRNIETLRQECGDGTQETFAEEDHILKLVQRWACGEVTELPVDDVLKYSVLEVLRRNGYLRSPNDRKNKRKGRSGRRGEFETRLLAEMVDANTWYTDAEGDDSKATGDGNRQPIADANATVADIADWNTPVLNRMADNADNAGDDWNTPVLNRMADNADNDGDDWNTPVLNRMADNADNDGDDCHFAHRMCMSFDVYFAYCQSQGKI